VRRHSVPWHVAPDVVRRRRLREPHVAGISAEGAVFASLRDDVLVAQLAARGIHEKAALQEGGGGGVRGRSARTAATIRRTAGPGALTFFNSMNVSALTMCSDSG